ncbi:MAG: Holliday junction resolvase RuvX [Clostridia bacterium]|nr:Holliday junction resolvase RuvX [Clostridia bacterium]
MRIMAFDIGDKRIGVAVSDPLGITAQGLETYTRTGDAERDADYLLSLARKYPGPVKLLFGMPRNMDGSYGFQSEKVREFAEIMLSKWDGEHDFQDERLSTVAAERVLNEAELDWRERRKVVDKVAAVMILQSYLGN